jgi:Zn-dependent protease
LFGSSPKLTLWRVRGIPVQLDATFLLVPVFLMATTSSHAAGDSAAAVIIGTLAIFLSILLHEAGHAVAAKLQKVGVSAIVVGGFYGYTTLKQRALLRKMLIRILACGPLANLAIFLALWIVLSATSPHGLGINGLAPAAPSPGWLEETARVVALVNLAMFVFNSLPAFPLDGGRILGLLLDRVMPARISLTIVAGLSIFLGAVMILLGLRISIILVVIGIMIIATNLRRLRSRPAARSRA